MFKNSIILITLLFQVNLVFSQHLKTRNITCDSEEFEKPLLDTVSLVNITPPVIITTGKNKNIFDIFLRVYDESIRSNSDWNLQGNFIDYEFEISESGYTFGGTILSGNAIKNTIRIDDMEKVFETHIVEFLERIDEWKPAKCLDNNHNVNYELVLEIEVLSKHKWSMKLFNKNSKVLNEKIYNLN